MKSNKKCFSVFRFFCFSVLIFAMLISSFGCNNGGEDVSDPTISATEIPEPTAAPRDISDQTNLASSIEYASTLVNGIQAVYDNTDRKNFIVTNLNSEYDVSFTGDYKGLQAIKNAGGATYIYEGMTAYVTDTDGNTYTTYNSTSKGRANTNRMGYYYYEVNLRDFAFKANSNTTYENEKSFNFKLNGKNQVDVSQSGNTLSGKLTGSTDPYFGTDLNVNLSDVNCIVFDLEYTGSSNSGCIFYGTSITGSGYSAEHYASFSFENNTGSKQTVVCYIKELDGKTFDAYNIRFDFDGGTTGDTFKISNVKFAKQVKTGSVNVGFEQTLHAYSDKVQNDIRIIYDETTTNLSEMGYQYKIPVASVSKILYNDGTSDKTELTGKSDIIYAGFDITDAGVIGFVVPNEENRTGTIELVDGYYVINIKLDITGKHKADSSSSLGHRVFTTGYHNFDDFKTEAYIERNPLTAEVTEDYGGYSKLKFKGYNTTTGAYEFSVSGTDFSTAYRKKNNNKYYGGDIEFSADDYDRKIYICCHGSNGCLEAAVLLDNEKTLVPISTEVCKNFGGEHEETYYDPNDTQYGDTIYPLVVSKNTNQKYTMLDIYQNWGTNKLKQISSISFHIGYYHLSTGTTESNCIAPYFVYGRDGWTLPDFRGCSGNIWSSQPQYNSVGRLRFLSYKTKANGTDKVSEYTGTVINSSGPEYADIEYSYISYDGNIAYTLRHVEFAQDDENRTYYTMTGTVLSDVTYNDAKNTFTLFSFDGRFAGFKNLSYKSADGTIVDKTVNLNKTTDAEVIELAKDSPFVSLYNFSSADIENFAYIVRDYNFTIGGKAYDGNLVLRNSVWADGDTMLNLIEISLNKDTLAFKAGDTFEMNFVLLPYGVANQTDDQNVHYVIEDTVDNPWRVSSVTTGEVVDDDWVCIINSENDVAEFTVTGSRDINVVRVNGFSKLTQPKIQELVNGEWVDYVLNVTDFDGYQVNVTEDNYFSYSFPVFMENYTEERTFRITIE